jgi:hypothetical protein
VELAELAEAQGDSAVARALWTEVSHLDENDARAAERAARATLDVEGSEEDAMELATRFLQIALFDPDAHGLSGRAAMGVRDWEMAVRELELELELGAEDRRETLQLLVEAHEQRGDDTAADAARRQLSP